MLSRTADHLYWMARYMERAENIARLLDVNYRLSLMPRPIDQTEKAWAATLRIMGLDELYWEKYDEISPENVFDLMIFDRENLSSIWNCLRAARENAHAVRGTITSELWEITNGTMLQDEAWRFTRIGTYLERADNTARIRDVKYQLLLPAGEVEGGAADYYQWSALLRSVSAFEVYRKVYRDLITPARVAL